MYSADEILEKSSLKALLVIFFNIKEEENKDYFCVYSSYRASKHSATEPEENIYLCDNKLLCAYTGLDFKLCGTRHILKINKGGLGLKDFVTKVYKTIQKASFEHSDDEIQRAILLALFALRGSIDIRANFFSVDVLPVLNKDWYYDMLLKILSNISDIRQLNLNFRELQPQYTSGKTKRNTQVRVNLAWFCNIFDFDISEINSFKSSILMQNKNEIAVAKAADNSLNFFEKLLKYKAMVLNKINSDDKKQIEIKTKELREAFGFNTEAQDLEVGRSANIVKIARLSLPEECCACKDRYDINDRSFKVRGGLYYLEIHHVIAFANGAFYDRIENLVKLCPTCHRALSKGRAFKEYQEELIKNILNNSNDAFLFVKERFSKEPSLEDMVQFVYDRLK